MSDEEMKELFILWAQEYCGTNWIEGEEPAGVKLFAIKATEWYKTQSGISGEKLGDYSVSFINDGEIPKGLLELLRPYRRIKFI